MDDLEQDRLNNLPEEVEGYAGSKNATTTVTEPIAHTPLRHDTDMTLVSAPKSKQVNYTHKALTVLAAFILLLFIISLEMFGAVKAAQGRELISDREVSWCAPIFQPFGLAVQMGCEFHLATQDSNRGIGCIPLPASTQTGWLKATEILMPLALVLQALDLGVMMLCHYFKEKGLSGKWREVKMQRPWFTV